MLKKIRVTSGLKQKEFGFLVGVTEGSWRQIEAGRVKLSFKLAERIARETGCGFWYIANEDLESKLESVDGITVFERKTYPMRLTYTAGFTNEPFTKVYFDDYRRRRILEFPMRSAVGNLSDRIFSSLQEASRTGQEHQYWEKLKKANEEVLREIPLSKETKTKLENQELLRIAKTKKEQF